MGFKPAAFWSLVFVFKRYTACYGLSLTLPDNLADYLHIMIRVEDVLSQQVILSTSSPQYTHPFLSVSTKSLHHPACVPVCLFILWAADVIWMMLALSGLTLFCPSILQSVCHIFCLSARHNHNHLFSSITTDNEYRGTWCRSMLTTLLGNMNSRTATTTDDACQSIYRIIGKAPITGIAAICCEQKLEPSSVLANKGVYCLVWKINHGSLKSLPTSQILSSIQKVNDDLYQVIVEQPVVETEDLWRSWL